MKIMPPSCPRFAPKLPPESYRAMRFAVLAQCAGVLASQLFSSGFMLSYLSLLGATSAAILFFLSLPNLMSFFLTLPFAYIADQFGKKRFGSYGLLGTVLGFALIASAGFLPTEKKLGLVVLGIGFFSISLTFFSAGWFALLEPIVPAAIRGRFFGTLRFSWQAVSILFNGLVIYVLHRYSALSIYQSILVSVTVFLAVRLYFYRRIPEIESTRAGKSSFAQALWHSLNLPGYLPFCSYTFLLMLFTGAAPWLFGLVEKDVLHFSDYQIVLMGNLLFVGSLLGFFLGGAAVDRLGTRMVFLLCHFSFSAVLFAFLLRQSLPFSLPVVTGILNALFGLAQAASGIAITTEMLALISVENKSLASALSLTLIAAGNALSGILSGKALQLGILAPSWTLGQQTLSGYDGLIAIAAVMILLLVVTLGLIPSVMRKARWVPQGN
ncbi:MAG TPA: hypothetical protein PKW76_15290 [bacterium]|nr:hypothetical protein [bacterium]HPG47041.1 hypothetical protein [bacterium]HPM99371.1 hypothetical protein [bacterium]